MAWRSLSGPSQLLAAASLPGTENVKAFIASHMAKGFTPPKTPWGHPDLQGVWDYWTFTPLERPKEFADKPVLTDAEAAQLHAVRAVGVRLEDLRAGLDVVLEGQEVPKGCGKERGKQGSVGDGVVPGGVPVERRRAVFREVLTPVIALAGATAAIVNVVLREGR